MKKPFIPYQPFDTFVFRLPLFPYDVPRKRTTAPDKNPFLTAAETFYW